MLLNSSALLNPVQSYHPCSHEYTDMQSFAMLYDSMMWRIPQNCKQNFGGDLSTIATLMFAVLHVLLNNSSREYTASLKNLCINFGSELSTIARLMFTVLQSYHLHAHQYTICIILQCTAFKDAEHIFTKCMIHLTQLGTVSSSHVK